MKKLSRAFLVLTAGLLSGLALVTGAAGTTASHASKVKQIDGPLAALAMDGNRIAYGIHPATTKDKVVVWNVRTGKTIKVSGIHTQRDGDSSTGSGLFQVALAGKRVAWMTNVGGNTEGDDYLFTSSLTKPRERQIVTEQRLGDSCGGRQADCAGSWLGGLVGSGNLMVFNRWTTDAQVTVTTGKLDVLKGTRMKAIATGATSVLAVSTDGSQVAVRRSDGSVAVYLAAGLVRATTSAPGMTAAAISGQRLVTVTKSHRLELYNTQTGAHEKTFAARGTKQPRNLDVQGNIAIYTVGSAVHAVNLSNGKDRVVAEHRGGPLFAQIDSAGLAYGGNGYGQKGTLVFVPLARITAAVG
jgi:hypothetical protein